MNEHNRKRDHWPGTGMAHPGVGLVIVYLAARRGWRRWRYGAPLDHSALLMEYGRKLTGALDRQALGQLLTVELPRALQVERAALLLPEAHQLVAAGRDDLRLPISHAAVRWVASGGEAQRADRGRLRELIQQGRTDLAWTRAWVPLMRGTDLRGLWLLGARNTRRTAIRARRPALPDRHGPPGCHRFGSDALCRAGTAGRVRDARALPASGHGAGGGARPVGA